MSYDTNVFINCPFDAAFAPLFDAIVFSTHDCGFVARSALEFDDAAEVRLAKIQKVIQQCRMGIHDISRTEPDVATGLPRFNMPLELGIFLGARRYGSAAQRRKMCLVLDREPYRYQQYISDIAGHDVSAHGGDVETVVRVVRDWLRNASRAMGNDLVMPGGRRMFERYQQFLGVLPVLRAELQLDADELLFNDYTTLVVGWLKGHAW